MIMMKYLLVFLSAPFVADFLMQFADFLMQFAFFVLMPCMFGFAVGFAVVILINAFIVVFGPIFVVSFFIFIDGAAMMR